MERDPQRRKIAANGLAELVDAVVVTEEIGAHKPSREAFRHVLSLLAIEPAAAAMVGDDLANDVDGALAAGFARVV
ncbi:MAG: HAD-IA family hydrolase [Candidatus Dormiibacterota bacterium]